MTRIELSLNFISPNLTIAELSGVLALFICTMFSATFGSDRMFIVYCLAQAYTVDRLGQKGLTDKRKVVNFIHCKGNVSIAWKKRCKCHLSNVEFSLYFASK